MKTQAVKILKNDHNGYKKICSLLEKPHCIDLIKKHPKFKIDKSYKGKYKLFIYDPSIVEYFDDINTKVYIAKLIKTNIVGAKALAFLTNNSEFYNKLIRHYLSPQFQYTL